VVAVAACLIDVYETVLTCDFRGHAEEMPRLAGLSPGAWNEGFRTFASDVGYGRITVAEAYTRVLRDAGVPDNPDLVQALVERDRELLVETTRVHHDTVPFLEALRERGVATAFVSNCADNTRYLLDGLGLTALVDALALSCELRCAKPDAPIYEAALQTLGVEASDTVFVDDQPAYCDGATALGMRAVRIDRRGESSARHGEWVVQSLTEVVDLLG
jgi:HAD superfamily hydrolase (TIGR01509 family)